MCSFNFFWWAMWANHSVRSPKVSNVSESLRSLTKNEWPWASHSGRSEEMRNRERIAQVAHQKWVNEQIARFFEQIAHSLIFSQKRTTSLRKPMSEFPALHISEQAHTFFFVSYTVHVQWQSKFSHTTSVPWIEPVLTYSFCFMINVWEKKRKVSHASFQDFCLE